MKQRIAALDGLRALAIGLVILYHIIPYQVPGGFFGVNIFLLLSGYLTMDKLRKLQLHSVSEYIGFFYKQVTKLFVQLITVVFILVGYITIVHPNMLFVVKQHVLATVLFLNNIWQIMIGTSYFDTYANQSPFTHMWYVALNVQLYVVLLVLYFIFRQKSPKVIGYTLLASLLSLFIIFLVTQNFSRVYYGLDTRAFTFLLGTLLAFVYPSERMAKRIKQSYVSQRIMICSIVCLLLLLFVFFVSDQNWFVYLGGLFLFDLLFAFFVVAAIHPNVVFDRLLSNPLLVMVGRRSYALYLWYFPIIQLYHVAVGSVSDVPLFHIGMQVVLIGLIGQLHYWLFTEFSFSALTKQTKQIVLGAVALLGCVVIYGLGFAQATENKDTIEMRQILENQTTVVEQSQESTSVLDDSVQEVSQMDTTSGAQDSRQETTKPAGRVFELLSTEEIAYAKDLSVTFVGDSTLGMMQYELPKIFPKATIDFVIGRQLYDSVPVINNLKTKGKMADTVVLLLGANGPFQMKHLEALVDAVGKNKKVYVVNNNLPETYQNANNDVFKQFVEKRPEVTLIDWYSYSKGKKEWFYTDLTHVTLEEGIYHFMDYITNQMYENR